MTHDQTPANAVRQAIDSELSFLDGRPSLYADVMSQIEGERKVKRKMSLGLVFALILVLLTGTAAVAVTYRGVSYFLVEKINEVNDLDPAYLQSNMAQNHNSKRLNATVVDAYWDGLELSIAYHVSVKEPGQVLRMVCQTPEHDHYLPEEEADIILWEPDFINITDENGDIDRPSSCSASWVYEEDGSLSVMVSFPQYDMSDNWIISIPIFNKLVATQDIALSMLHCESAVLVDPLPAHEHAWTEATCVSPRWCTVCKRMENELGYHDYSLNGDGNGLTCSACGKTVNKPVYVPAGAALIPGDEHMFVLALQLKLHELGCYTGRYTGVYTDETTAAVKAWQAMNDLETDGIAHEDMLEKLFR